MKWLREALLGNWRNKGVAMFFAVTIWFVAYQSEKTDTVEEYTVSFRPEDESRTIITGLYVGGSDKRFDQRILVSMSGPRKLIAEAALRGKTLPPFVVSREDLSHSFSRDDFEFAGKGMAITSVAPPSVRITQDDLETKTIEDLHNRINVTSRLENHRLVSAEVQPPQVRIEGPASVVKSVDVRLNFSMDLRDRNKGPAKVVRVFTDESVSESLRALVRVIPDTVMVEVTTEAETKTLPLDGVRLSFRVRMPGVAFKIVSDDFDPVSGTIPVELVGPVSDIARIEELHKRSAIVLCVPVRRAIQPDQESIRLFDESDLELYGFPAVQVRQHKSRREKGKGSWSYQIVPVVEKKDP